jgi:hypothetical protein
MDKGSLIISIDIDIENAHDDIEQYWVIIKLGQTCQRLANEESYKDISLPSISNHSRSRRT